MSNLNVGGIEGDLVLNIAQWTQPAREALSSVQNLGSNINTAMNSMASATESAAQKMGTKIKDTSIRFTDFGKDAKKVSEWVRGSFGAMSSDVNLSLQTVRSTFQDVSRGIGQFATELRQGIKASVTDFLQFQQEMRNVDAIAKLSEAQLTSLTKSVRDMGGGGGPLKLAAGLKEIAGYGWDAASALQILRASAKGASAGDTDTKIVAKGLSPTLKSFGLGADKSMLVMDQLFKGMDQGNLSAEDMATQLGGIAPIAGSAGVSLQELTGTFALMSTKGETASQNATQLREAMTHILAPAALAGKLLKAYGVDAGETAIRTKGLVGVLKDLFEKTGGNKDALKKILDVEGMQAAVKIVGGDKGKEADRFVKNQFGADGATEDAFARRSKALLFQLEQVKAAFQNFFIGAAAGLEPILSGATEQINKLATYLVKLPDGTKAAIGGFAALAAAGLTLFSGLTLLAPTFIQIGTFIAKFGGFAEIASVGATVLGESVAALASAVASAAAPVIALVAAVAVLGTAWKEDWGGIREFTASVLADIEGYAKSAGKAIQENFGPVLAEISADFKAAWPDIKDFVVYLGKSYFEVAIPAVKAFWEASKTSWAGISEAVKVAWGVIGPIVKFIGQEFKDQIAIVAQAISGDWQGAMDQWVSHFYDVGPRLLAALKEIAANVVTGMADLGNKVKQAFQDAFTFTEHQDESGWKASIDGPISRSVDIAKDKFKELSTAGQQAFFDISRSFRMPHASWAGGSGSQFASSAVRGTGASSVDQIGGGMDGYHDPGPTPDVRRGSGSHAKKATLTPAQMLAYIRSNAGVYGDIGGLDQDTLKATFELVRNSVLADFKLQITSGKRSGSGGSFHNSGRAVDIQAMGRANNRDDEQVPGMIQRLASGTGFRSGINEFRSDALAVTGGTGPHLHLTTGLERTGPGAVPGAFMVKGGGGSGGTSSMVAALAEYQKDLVAAQKLIGEYISKPINEFDIKRQALKKDFDKVTESAKLAGADPAVMGKVTAEFKRRIAEVNDAERQATAKTSQDLVITRLEAEGKMGDAAKARILATADQEKEHLQDLLKQYPALAQQINETMASLDQGTARQLQSQAIQTSTGRVEDKKAIQSFQASDPGAAAMIDRFPQFRADVEAAYKTIQAYIQDPAEATRAAFQESAGFLSQLSGAAQEEQQKRMADIDFERQMGQITKEEAIQRQADLLNNWVGGEDQKRQMMLGMVDTYRENFQTQLDMQGEFNIASLEQFVESLTELDSLTMAQQAQLAAANQMIAQQRITDQQGWQGILQQTQSSFQTFISSVLSGQQTFGEAFKALWKGIANMVIQELSRMIAKALVLFALQKALGFFSGGASELLSGAGMMDLGIGLGHSGGLVQHGNIMPMFHSGGWVGGPLRSDETMAVLQTGEYVLSRQQLAQGQAGGGQGGGVTNVNAPISMTNYINGEMDIDRVANQLGRKMSQVLQGAY